MFNFLNQIATSVYAEEVNPIIGNIAVPAGIPQEVGKTGDLLSAIVRFLVVVAGVYTLWQFLSGGLGFITSNGDKGKLTEAQNKIQSAIIGLVIMAGSFIIIAIISQILFGDFLAILVPKLTPVSPSGGSGLPPGAF
jgi:hypothetical protein